MKIGKLTFFFLMVLVHDIMSRKGWVETFPGAMGNSLGEKTSYSLGGESSRTRIESVIEALRKVADVERQLHENKGCNKFDLLNITFDERRWKKEALLAVQVANLMTSLWRVPGDNGYPVAANDALLYHYVGSNVLFSPSVFGSAICFDNNSYKNYTRFCPYAFRDSNLNGSVHVFDIANGDFDYTTDLNTPWWHKPKNNALTFKPAKSSSMYEERFNATARKAKKTVVVPRVTFESGTWTRPYFDCFGGKVWMVTYLAPIFNETDEFFGVVSVDVALSDIDINQCDNQYTSEQGDKENLIEFMGTHLCKPSTKCETVLNQGFKRGSYVCTCKRGFYFPDALAPEKAFSGSVIEREHDRMLRGESNAYENNFDCRRCSEGCDECVDGSPCIYTLKIVIRLLLCCLNGAVMVLTIELAVYVALHWKDKIFKASSPRFMEIIFLGALLMYSTLIVSYFKPTDISCVIKPWLQHIGFSLVYGPLALKTWRVALIFRVRSAQKLALSDGVLFRRLCLLVLLYCSYLTAWTAFHPPVVETARTSGDLKYERCVENWFNLTLIFGDMMVLIWGMWLSYKIRNAPPAYNESKMISWAVYSAMFVTSFLMVVRTTTKGNTNPDLLYGLDFVLIHMDCSTVIVVMFAHKYSLVHRMRRRVNDCTSSHNNMLVPEEEIVEEQSAHQEEQSLRKENQELKEEMRRLRVKLATLQSNLMKEDNHHMKKLSGGGAFIRRKSAFTMTRKGEGHVHSMRRHSLQLAPTLQDLCKGGREISQEGPDMRGELRDCNSELIPEFIEMGRDILCPQELNQSAAFLYSDSLHSRIYHPSGPT